MQFRSQYGQDALIGEVLFKGKRGVFVDVGARDGLKFSNTAYLEQAKGWTGIAVEPHPDLFAELKSCRKCQCIDVAASSGPADSLQFIKMLEEPFGNSGLLSTFRDRRRLETIKHEIISVPARPVSGIIKHLPVVHYLDVDVEGHELEVLKGVDFDATDIRVIGVEALEGSKQAARIDDFMNGKGYQPFAHLISDRFYCRGFPSERRLTNGL